MQNSYIILFPLPPAKKKCIHSTLQSCMLLIIYIHIIIINHPNCKDWNQITLALGSSHALGACLSMAFSTSTHPLLERSVHRRIQARKIYNKKNSQNITGLKNEKTFHVHFESNSDSGLLPLSSSVGKLAMTTVEENQGTDGPHIW